MIDTVKTFRVQLHTLNRDRNKGLFRICENDISGVYGVLRGVAMF